MNYSLKRQFTSLVTVLAFTLGPVTPAFADYNSVCNNHSGTVSTADSDKTKALCAEAKVSKITHDYNTAKTVIFTVATAYLTTAAFIPYLAGTCPAVSYGAMGAGIGLDIVQAIKTHDATAVMNGAISALGSEMIKSGISKLAGVGAKAGEEITTQAAQVAADKAAAAAKKAACLTSALGTGIQAATAIMTAKAASQAENSTLAGAADLKDARASVGFQVANNGSGTQPQGSKQAAAQPDAISDCGSQGGNNYLKCIGQTMPEVAAITNSPDAMNALEGSLGGQSLGDLAKGYQGDGSSGSLANYVGGAMGASPSGIAALSKAIDDSGKYAQDAGINDKYTPGGYSSAGNKVASTGGDDINFNKMMEGMLKQLNPDAAKNGEDPSTIVFRQLDLLPPDKIEANKDISLFARIGYRYRKKSTDMDQLNWANPQNQASSSVPDSRSPASVH